MKILLTGDDGYIGSVMTSVISKKHEVIGVDTEYFRSCKLYDYEESYRIRKDIRDISVDDFKKNGIDAVIHLAALSNDPLGEINPALTSIINFEASVRLAKIAAKSGVKRFLFPSSCSVYGISDGVADENTILKPLTAYARSKINAEKELLKINEPQFSPVILRNPTVFGLSPKLRSDLVLNNFVLSAMAVSKITIMSDGTPWRPMIHVNDMSRIFLEMLEAPDSVVKKQIVNTGFDAQNYQVRDIAQIVSDITGAPIEYKQNPVDSRSYKVSFKKFENMLPKLRPKWNLKKGAEEIKNTVGKSALKKEEFLTKFSRISCLKDLISSNMLDEDLRWKAKLTVLK